MSSICISFRWILALLLLPFALHCELVRAQCDGCIDATQIAGYQQQSSCYHIASAPAPSLTSSSLCVPVDLVGCPYPELCGFKTINCTDPISNPHREWCSNITCANCMSGMQMPGCPDPAACGFGLLPCVGCSLKAITAGSNAPTWTHRHTRSSTGTHAYLSTPPPFINQGVPTRNSVPLARTLQHVPLTHLLRVGGAW